MRKYILMLILASSFIAAEAQNNYFYRWGHFGIRADRARFDSGLFIPTINYLPVLPATYEYGSRVFSTKGMMIYYTVATDSTPANYPYWWNGTSWHTIKTSSGGANSLSVTRAVGIPTLMSGVLDIPYYAGMYVDTFTALSSSLSVTPNLYRGYHTHILASTGGNVEVVLQSPPSLSYTLPSPMVTVVGKSGSFAKTVTVLGGGTINGATTLTVNNGESYTLVSNGLEWRIVDNMLTGGGSETDPLSWNLLGNTGTTMGTNFVGTTDAQGLMFKTNNAQRFSISATGAELKTYSTDPDSSPGGGFFVNSGNPDESLVTYPGANIGISGGHLGQRSLNAITGGYWNIAIGDLALNNTTNGTSNIALGYRTMINNTTGFGNTALGERAMENPTESYANVAIGGEALRYSNNGYNNVAVGYFALRGNGGTAHLRNIGIGNYTCPSCGPDNVTIGRFQGASNLAGDGANATATQNVAIGNVQEGYYGGLQYGASRNSVVGYWAGFEGIQGNDNVIVGAEGAASGNFGLRVDGARNTILGTKTSGVIGGASGNIIVGAYVGAATYAGSGTLNIGNVLYGSGMYNTATVSNTPTTTGKIGVGGMPTSQFHVFSNSGTAGYSMGEFLNTNLNGLAFLSAKNNNGSSVGISATGSNYVTSYDVQNVGAIAATGSFRQFRLVSNGDIEYGGTMPITLQPGGFATYAMGSFHKDYVRLGKISTEAVQVTVTATNGYIGIGTYTPTAIVDIKASTTAAAAMRLRVGSAPTAPNDGDIWLESNTSTGLKIRLNGTTYTISLL